MFTGRWPHEQTTNWESALDSRDVTLAEFLRGRGYMTAGFAANGQYCGHEFGLDRGFAHYEDYVATPQETLLSSSLGRMLALNDPIRRALNRYDTIARLDATAVNRRFLDWLSHVDERPFFAFLNYFDAHETYLPPPQFAMKFGPGEPRSNQQVTQELRRSLRNDWHKRPPEEIQAEVDVYDGAISYIDDELGRLLDGLRSRGLLDNTIVIVTSDHGEQFGEHGLFLHSNSLYHPLLHVPLLISYPGRVPSGQRVDGRASLRDIPATIVELIGAAGDQVFPGASLSRYWSAPNAHAGDAGGATVLSEVKHSYWAEKWQPASRGDMHSLMNDRHHYIRNGDGREELYAIRTDPTEEHDLSGSEESRPLLERFRAELAAELVDSVRKQRSELAE
jgi:arylsulfatase A-like enzyme